MSYTTFNNDDDHRQILKNQQSILQRWLYGLVGTLTMLPILVLTLREIRNLSEENREFSIYLVLFFHSALVFISILFAAFTARINDALLTVVNLILLFAYTGLHFYSKILLSENISQIESTSIALRIGFVAAMFIILFPWTCILTHLYGKIDPQQRKCTRSGLFSWFVNLNFLLTISLFLLNIRNRNDFDEKQWIFLSIAFSISILWLIIGNLLCINKSRHWTLWLLFYVISLIELLYFAYVLCWTFYQYESIVQLIEVDSFPWVMMKFACVASNVLVHLLTMIISFSLICSQI